MHAGYMNNNLTKCYQAKKFVSYSQNFHREFGNFHLVRGANNTLSLDLNTLIGGTKKELAINSKHVYAETSYFEAHSGIHPDSITKTLVAEQKGFYMEKLRQMSLC
jgi:hypothetical protein